MNYESYRKALRPALEHYCEVYPTQAQLDGLLGGLGKKNLTPEAYFEAEAYALKAALGCVEAQIRQAQEEAVQKLE